MFKVQGTDLSRKCKDIKDTAVVNIFTVSLYTLVSSPHFLSATLQKQVFNSSRKH